MSKVIKNVVLLAVFIICLALIIIGQKNISVTGLCMELIGLAGLLVLLFLYNGKYKSRRRHAIDIRMPPRTRIENIYQFYSRFYKIDKYSVYVFSGASLIFYITIP